MHMNFPSRLFLLSPTEARQGIAYAFGALTHGAGYGAASGTPASALLLAKDVIQRSMASRF